MTRSKLVLAACTLVFFGTRCSDSGIGPTAPDTTIVSISIDPLSATLRVGETKQIIATGVTASKTQITTGITITSSNPAVVNVGTNGLIRALTPGTATLTATAGTASAIAAITVTPGLPATLTKLAGDAQSAIVSTVLPISPSVVVKDSAGNLISGAVVTFTVVSGGGLINGAAAVSDAQGVATLSTWILGSITGTQTLLATVLPSVGTVTATFSALALPKPPAAIVSILPNAGDGQTAIVGTLLPISPSVTVRDADGLLAANVPVVFTVVSGGGAITGATTIPTNAAGVATVGGWTLGSTLGPQTLTAKTGTLTAVTFTATATAVPLPATHLAVASSGGTALIGVPMATPPRLEVRDDNENVVTTANNTVTVTISFGGRLTGTTVVNAVNGVAVFDNLIGLDAGTYTLLWQSPGLASATSTLRVTSAQPATTLAVRTPPSGGTTTTLLTVQPVIELRDASNVPAQGTNPVTVSVQSGPGTLYGTLTINAIDGQASFADLGLTQAGTYTLLFSSTGLGAVVSAPFTVGFSPAVQMVVTTQPVGAASGALLATQPVIQLRDALGNLAGSSTNSVTVTLSGSGGTLSGTTTVAAVNGIVTFTNLRITGAGTYVLNFASASTGVASSATVTITP